MACRSEWQTPVASILTVTSPGPGGRTSRSSTISSFSSPVLSSTAARMFGDSWLWWPWVAGTIVQHVPSRSAATAARAHTASAVVTPWWVAETGECARATLDGRTARVARRRPVRLHRLRRHRLRHPGRHAGGLRRAHRPRHAGHQDGVAGGHPPARPHTTGSTCADPDYLAWVLRSRTRATRSATTTPPTTRRPAPRPSPRSTGSASSSGTTRAPGPTTREPARPSTGDRTASPGPAPGPTAGRSAARPGQPVGEGDDPTSPYFWADVLRDRVDYWRNFSVHGLDTLAACPTMPYHDPRPPYVNRWFASSHPRPAPRPRSSTWCTRSRGIGWRPPGARASSTPTSAWSSPSTAASTRASSG